MTHTFTMETPIIEFKNLKGDVQLSWDVSKAVEGTLILGSTGSGKTSGSARTIATMGRLSDLIVIEPGGEYFFNFLDYESTDRSGSKSYTENVVQVLKTVIKASEEKSSGKSDDPFWESALDMLLYNTIELCQLAYEKVSVQEMYTIVLSAPKAEGEQKQDDNDPGNFAHAMKTAKSNVQKLVVAYKETLSDRERAAQNTPHLVDIAISKAIPNAARLKSTVQFFKQHYLNLSEKTRSIVDFSFSAFLFRLLKDPAYSLFCKNPSNITPEDCLEGKIILINLPVKDYDKVGRDCQTMFKYIWQRAIEKRNIYKNGRPVFLFADEAQNFLHAYDTEFQTTARSSRVAAVYISQNTMNYYAFMGGNRAKEKVSSLFGNLGTKIFHANSDIQTNKYSSELFGDEEVSHKTTSENFSNDFSFGTSESSQFRRRVRPEEFVNLKSGKLLNNFFVEGYFHIQSDTFSNGLNFKKATFSQKYIPSPSKLKDYETANQTSFLQGDAPAPKLPPGFDIRILSR